MTRCPPVPRAHDYLYYLLYTEADGIFPSTGFVCVIMSNKDFNIAIVGGGLCGLAAAVPLFKAGLNVKVFENAPGFGEVGAGVGLGPNSIRALDALGVLSAVVARSEQAEPTMRVFNFVSGYEGHEEVFDYQTTNPTNVGLGIYRPAFLDALISLLDPSVTEFSKHCISITTSDTGKHIIHFADRSTYEADLVIGTDGIKSVTRGYVVGNENQPLKYTHTAAYRALVPYKDLLDAGLKTDLVTRPQCFIGLDRHVITFPIQGNKTINIVAFVADHDTPWTPELPPPWVNPSSQSELKNYYKEFGSDVMIILDHMKVPSKWSVHAFHPPLESFVKDGVVLVGDAAHPMLPHLGAGVGQGFEDVLVLTHLLTHPQTKKANLSHVLAQYNKVRPPRANSVLHGSTRAGEIYDSFHPTAKNDVETTAKLLNEIWEPVWNYDLKKDLEKCVGALEEQGVFAKEA
ncbi:FAD/NAD(P)-binding domain-containing protein [Dendrothele bispora CBS 962.96]|uniref:FAD/NAD(P)-binding domain-containing protein n=1 Tax=Dendrothele bispora (strain CBS 962.96) TaxID=1314807 RepID=A0A4S8MG49_DENBC|nr:FAD/NAD(P)-binding domain-containing protein [Dendrothele bispora CBS 962.96]